MASMEQVKFKQILISQFIIENQGIVQICQLINTHNRKNAIKVLPKCFQRNNNYQIKVTLLTQMSNINKKQLNQKWLICYDFQLSTINVDQSLRGIVALIQNNQNISHHNFMVFQVRTFKQGLNILSLPQSQLQKRIKMQKMLKKSKIKYINIKLKQDLIEIANKLFTELWRKQIKVLSSGLRFVGVRRLRLMRKYFNQWLINHYEDVINKRQIEIAQSKYLLLNSHKKLKEKVFSGWKKLRFRTRYQDNKI